MFTKALILLLSFATLLVEAGITHDLPRAPAGLHRRPQRSLVRRSATKSCTVKSRTNTNNTSTTPGKGNNGGGGNQGVINVPGGKCGKPEPNPAIVPTNGPNGKEDWLNCGVDGSGWTPPMVTHDDLIVVPLAEAIQDKSSPFKACSPYVSIFQKYGNQYGINDTVLAAIALQESSCNPNADAGTIGLMQITTDKCDVPQNECKQPDNNVRIGTKYLADLLQQNNNNIVACMGQYNGWFTGMTIADATKAASQGHCAWQQNLDYLQQFFNGWLQNKDPYALKLGKYFNVDKCT